MVRHMKNYGLQGAHMPSLRYFLLTPLKRKPVFQISYNALCMGDALSHILHLQLKNYDGQSHMKITLLRQFRSVKNHTPRFFKHEALLSRLVELSVQCCIILGIVPFNYFNTCTRSWRERVGCTFLVESAFIFIWDHLVLHVLKDDAHTC